MSRKTKKYINNVKDILEEKGYDIENVVVNGDQVTMSLRRFSMTMDMKFSLTNLGIK